VRKKGIVVVDMTRRRGWKHGRRPLPDHHHHLHLLINIIAFEIPN